MKTLDVSDLPMVCLPRVWHVGTLDPSKKWCHGDSYEGSGLSVSLDPEAWKEIARLGGLPTHLLSKARQPGRFVDRHALDERILALLRSEAIAEGLLEPATRYQVSYFDTECDSVRRFLVASKALADEEAEDLGDDSDAKVTPLEILVATPALHRVVGQVCDDLICEDMALTVLLEQAGICDGIWWNDVHDVAGLSAPRGVIFKTALPAWTCVPA